MNRDRVCVCFTDVMSAYSQLRCKQITSASMYVTTRLSKPYQLNCRDSSIYWFARQPNEKKKLEVSEKVIDDVPEINAMSIAHLSLKWIISDAIYLPFQPNAIGINVGGIFHRLISVCVDWACRSEEVDAY